MDASEDGIDVPADPEASRPANPRPSRWGDSLPLSNSNTNSVAVEPFSKKPRNNVQAQGAFGGDTPSVIRRDDPSSVTTGPATSVPVVSNPSYGADLAVGPTSNFTYSGSQAFPPGYGGHSTGSASFAPGSAKGNGIMFYKTKLCNNFKTGACSFNERCHFAHGVEELRKMPTPWEAAAAGAIGGRSTGPVTGAQPRKVRMCKYYLEGNCPYAERCNFLHGNEQPQALDSSGAIRSATPSWPSYKSQMCAKWEKGEVCEYGEKCYYAHGYEELQRTSGVATFPNRATTVPDVQQTSFAPVMNTPPVVGQYAAPVNYPVPLNPSYSNTGATVPMYFGSQQRLNGTSYGYWATSAPPIQPAIPSHGYSEPSSWMIGYAGDGGMGTGGTYSQYPQVQPQAQVQPQGQVQVQGQGHGQAQAQAQAQAQVQAQAQAQAQALALAAAPAPAPAQQYQSLYLDKTIHYPQPTQTTSYVPAGGYQNMSYGQGEVRTGEGGYYQASSNYSAQQANYGSGYPVV